MDIFLFHRTVRGGLCLKKNYQYYTPTVGRTANCYLNLFSLASWSRTWSNKLSILDRIALCCSIWIACCSSSKELNPGLIVNLIDPRYWFSDSASPFLKSSILIWISSKRNCRRCESILLKFTKKPRFGFEPLRRTVIKIGAVLVESFKPLRWSDTNPTNKRPVNTCISLSLGYLLSSEPPGRCCDNCC